MAKFKVGDRVRVVGTDVDDPYSVGDTGKIKEGFDPLYNLYTILFDSGKVDWATEKQLEFVPKFKLGDKVVVVGMSNPIGNNGYFYTEGMIGRVELLEEDEEGPVAYICFEDTGNWPEGAVNLFGRVWVGEEDLTLLNKKENWWETPEGIEWLSTQQDIEEQFLKSQERTYHVGQRFLASFKDTTWSCILAQVEFNAVCLIGLDEGNRINDPVKVGHSKNITESEMKKIAGNSILQLL